MSYKVLIVDDNETNSQLLENMLKGFSDEFDCSFAEDGLEGYKIAKKVVPDVIFMDLMMPKCTGIECLKKIRKEKRLKDIPVIFVTAFRDDKNFTEAFDEGAIDYIEKPINIVELQSRLNKALNISNTLNKIKSQLLAYEEEKKQFENNVLLAKEQLNSFIILDPTGKMLWANEGFKNIHGCSFDDFIASKGNTLSELIEDKKIDEKLQKCIESKSPFHHEYKLHSDYYDIKYVQTFVSPQLNGTDKIEKLIAFETDITSFKLKEEDLHNQNIQMLNITENLEKANLLLEEQKQEINLQKATIEDEQQKSEKLLLNILPFEVAKQLKSKGKAGTRYYKLATVLFTDFKGFAKLSKGMEPKDLVDVLDGYFAKFDEITENHYLEKIKTIGDSYMCAGGLPLRNKSNPVDAVLAGLEIQDYMNKLNDQKVLKKEPVWELRVGVHTGPLVAGVVGRKKFAYDIWGETVNVASRMEKTGHVGMVNISGVTYEYIKDFIDCDYRGKIEAKNIGKIDMYFVNRIKPEYSADELGLNPNDELLRLVNKI
jgi:class 3 adenylate cyclase/CheY-like chemotaxis protein